MDASASAALTVSIVAVVLGGIGLISGVIGYVQGTAALQRATTARQRATGAEEAALQARAAAEATTRSAEELLERLQRHGVAAATTGPVAIGAVSTGAVPSFATGQVGIAPVSSRPPAPQSPGGGGVPAASSGDAAPRTRVESTPVQPRVATGRSIAVPVSSPAPAPAEQQPAAAFEIPLTAQPSDGPGAVAPVATPAPFLRPEADPGPASGPLAAATTAAAVPPTGPALGADAIDAGRPAQRQPAEAFAFPVSPAPAQPAAPAVSEQEDEDSSRAREGAGFATPPAGRDVAALQQEQVVVGSTPPAPQDVAATQGDAAPEPDGPADVDPAAPERGSRGQVVVGSQDSPPMDWAEVLRTGAIPLPSISRGTYAAPRRAPKPAGQGPARFELRLSGRQRYQAVNVGGESAEEARVEGSGDDPHLVRPLSSRPATVPPGGALAFSVLRVEGRDASAQVRWTRGGDVVTQKLPLD